MTDVPHEVTVRIADLPEVRDALGAVAVQRDAILAQVDEIVCDYQCGNGTRPDGSWGWVCGCGNVAVADAIRALLAADE